MKSTPILAEGNHNLIVYIAVPTVFLCQPMALPPLAAKLPALRVAIADNDFQA